MKVWLSKAAGLAARSIDLRDLHCYAGAIIATGGLWQFDPRIAVVCLGVFIAWLGVRR